MSSDHRSFTAHERQVRAVQSPRAKKIKTTRREDLTPDQRADFERKFVAKQQRNRPPSI